MTAVIQIDDMTCRYGDLTAVKSLSLSVQQGEIFGFLGPNGAGKTTTIRAIVDLIRPAQGSVKILGMLHQSNSVEIKKQIGYLPSELVVWDNWTGMDYIRWLEGVHGRPLQSEANQLAEQFEFNLKRSLSGLSTGMKRKMGLIATLAPKPQVLILDEPTLGLDPLMQHAFNELMHATRSEGRTVFLSSHILSEVEEICDRVGLIREGELQAVETVIDMTHLAFRWLVFTLNHQVGDFNDLNEIQGVLEIIDKDSTLRIRISRNADMNAILRAITRYDVQDMTIQNPNLEEVFMTYYGAKV